MIRVMKPVHVHSTPNHAARQPDAPPLDAEVAHVVEGLRAALAEVFFALAKPIRGGTDIQREFGLPSTLSWQLHAFVNARKPLTAIDHIPGRQASRRFLAAAAAKDVPSDLIERATAAFNKFEACVERHTGSRAAFSSMVSGLAPVESSVDLKARRDMFRAASRIYSVHLETLINCYILHRGATPGRFDYIFITGWVGLQVTRPFEKLFVGRHRSTQDKPTPGLAKPRPVAPSAANLHNDWCIPLLEEFSTVPLSRFSAEPGPDGMCEIFVSGQPVGRTGSLTYFLAQHWPGAVPHDEEMRCDTTHLYPAEHVVHNILLGPGVAHRVPNPKTGIYGGSLHELRCRYRDVDRLNVPAQTAFMGEGLEPLRTPLVPRYLDILRYVCTQMNWDPNSFDAYRCEVEYPVLHSLLNTTFPAVQPVESTHTD